MCWNSLEGTRTNRMRPLAWLKRVGFNHVSKDWRMTFFSRAARICSQGLRAEAGEIANAIELILAGVTCVLPCEFNRAVKTMAHAVSGAIAHPHSLTEDMPDGRWFASENTARHGLKFTPWDARKLS